MTLDDVMEKLFMELVPSFLANVPDDEKEDYEQYYKDLLTEKYSKILAESIVNDDIDTNDSIRIIVNKEKLLWANATFFNKRQYFNVDEEYHELTELSDEVFNKVIDFYDNGEVNLDDMPYEETINKASKLLDGVDESNIEMGQLQYDRIKTDLDYLYGKSEYISVRFSDYMESNPKGEKQFHIKRKTVNEIMNKYISDPESIITRTESYINDKDYDGAISFIKAYLTILEERYQNTDFVRYYTFNNPIEQMLFIKKFNPEYRIEALPYNIAKAYMLYAYCLRMQGELEKALRVIDFSMEWNPVYGSALFEKAMILHEQGEIEQFHDVIKSSYEFLYGPHRLSRYYRNEGLYYLTIKDYHTANALYTYSKIFVPDDVFANTADERIKQIMEEDSTITGPATYEEIIKVFKEKNIKLGIDSLPMSILQALFDDGKDRNTSLYKYTADLLYALTNDPKYNVSEEDL